MPACSFWRQIVLSWIVNRTIALGHRAVRLYQYQLLPSRSGSCKACHRRTAEHFSPIKQRIDVLSCQSPVLSHWGWSSGRLLPSRMCTGGTQLVKHPRCSCVMVFGVINQWQFQEPKVEVPTLPHTHTYLYTYCLCKGYVREYLKKYSLIWYNIFNLGSWNSHRPKEASRETPSYGWVQ